MLSEYCELLLPCRTDPHLNDMPIVYASDAFVKLTGTYILFWFWSFQFCYKLNQIADEGWVCLTWEFFSMW